MGGIDEVSFLVIVAIAALSGIVAMFVEPKLAIPVVVIELLLGIVIGPQVLDLAQLDDSTDFFGNLGLGMLFFFAGYEIDFERIRGRPLKLGAIGWILSLLLAYGLGGILAAAGIIVSYLYTGSAMATTAIGTLIPILRDAGELRTKFGTNLLAAGAVGEFGPILLITLILSTGHPLHEALILVVFIALAVVTGLFAVRSAWKGWPLLERSIESSAQLAVRLAVVLVFSLVALASDLGLDLLLGGFVAGLITRLAVQGQEVRVLDSKLTAIGYGFLIPFFFVTSGMAFDLDALLSGPDAVAKMFMFVALFLVVRGVPALLLYRHVMDARDRLALAFLCATELPLVVAITTLAVEAGHMRSSTSAGLVGAAIVSTLVFPMIGLKLATLQTGRSRRAGRAAELAGVGDRTTRRLARSRAIAAGLGERDQTARFLVDQLQADRLDPVPEGEHRDVVEDLVLVVRALQVVVRDARVEVVHVVQADVAGEELQRLRAASDRSCLEGPRRRSSSYPSSPSRRPRTGAGRRRARRRRYRP